MRLKTNIAFTLCSNNYLAQAKVLGDSFKKHHPHGIFIIGLVDKMSSEIDYSFLSDFIIVPVDEVAIADLQQLSMRYDIVELNTVVKPSYFSYLFKRFKAERIIFLDPDIEVFSPFDDLLHLLDTYNIVVTPQNCAPIDDGESPSDLTLLGTGIFNLGFIALAGYESLIVFLKWWNDRVLKYGYAKPSSNMFFDQIWINLVPVFFDNCYILKHPGYNMSPSNLHERKITDTALQPPQINGQYRLLFYHYSGFRYNDPGRICSYSNRFTFEQRPDILPLYEDYRRALIENNIESLSAIVPFYGRQALERSPVKRSKFFKAAGRVKRAAKVIMGKS
jgi:hypothetical protein